MDGVRIEPIALEHAAGYRACLDTVAREKRYLAQTEALPLARIEDFVRDSVKNDAVQFVALVGDQVVGWADIFPAWAQAIAHCGGLGMGVHPDFRGRGIGEQLLRACLDKAQHQGITRVDDNSAETKAWVKAQNLKDYPMPPADIPLIPILRDWL